MSISIVPRAVQTIQKNWTRNVIPNIVLSSATLPKEDEINEVVADFKNKHSYFIISY